MLIIVYVFFILLNIILFLYGRRGRLTEIVTGCFIILFAMGRRYLGGYVSYDLKHYESNYTNPIDMKEVGYSTLRNIGIKCGLSFYEFYMVLIAIFLIVLFFMVKKCGTNMHLFFVTYLIYYILIPTNQLKAFCAFVILFFSFKWIITDNRYDIIKYVIGVLIASLFHPSFLLYLVFVIVKFSKTDKFPKILGTIFVFFSVFSIVSNSQQKVANVLNVFLADYNSYDRFDKYFTSVSKLSPLAMVAVLGVYVILSIYWRKVCEDYLNSEDRFFELPKVCDYRKQVFFVAIISSCFLPLLFMNMTFYRYIREISLLIICYSSAGINFRTATLKKRSIILLLVLAVSLGLFVYDVRIKGSYIYWNDYWTYFFQNSILSF